MKLSIFMFQVMKKNKREVQVTLQLQVDIISSQLSDWSKLLLKNQELLPQLWLIFTELVKF